MRHIELFDARQAEWRSAHDLLSEDQIRERGAGDVTAMLAMHFVGGDDAPQLCEVSYSPGAVVPPHAHPKDEIVLVLAGSIMVGRRELGPGSSLSVAANTLYGFRAGSEGLRLAIFRATGGPIEYISKPEFMRRRDLMLGG